MRNHFLFFLRRLFAYDGVHTTHGHGIVRVSSPIQLLLRTLNFSFRGSLVGIEGWMMEHIAASRVVLSVLEGQFSSHVRPCHSFYICFFGQKGVSSTARHFRSFHFLEITSGFAQVTPSVLKSKPAVGFSFPGTGCRCRALSLLSFGFMLVFVVCWSRGLTTTTWMDFAFSFARI